MNILVRVAPWFLIVGLLGCVTYVEPTGGATASIRFVSNTGSNVATYDLDEKSCESNKKLVANIGAVLRSDGRKKLGLPMSEGLDEVHYSEVRIPASQPFNFTMESGYQAAVTVVHCQVRMRLDPAPGAIYEARYQWSNSNNRCSMEVDEIRQGPSGAYQKVRAQAARPLPAYCSRK